MQFLIRAHDNLDSFHVNAFDEPLKRHVYSSHSSMIRPKTKEVYVRVSSTRQARPTQNLRRVGVASFTSWWVVGDGGVGVVS